LFLTRREGRGNGFCSVNGGHTGTANFYSWMTSVEPVLLVPGRGRRALGEVARVGEGLGERGEPHQKKQLSFEYLDQGRKRGQGGSALGCAPLIRGLSQTKGRHCRAVGAQISSSVNTEGPSGAAGGGGCGLCRVVRPGLFVFGLGGINGDILGGGLGGGGRVKH